MLHLHRSERAEALIEPLAAVLAEPVGDPFTSDVVAVPTKGVERWLAQQLSHRLGASADGEAGVCAAIAFDSPARLVARVLAGVLDLDPRDDPWAVEALTWPLLTVLDQSLHEPWCASVARHLGTGHLVEGPDRPGDPTQDEADSHRSGRRLALARRLAGLYSSYTAQRPSLVLSWRDRRPDGVPPDLQWQVELWWRLRERIGVPSPAERLDDAVRLLRADPEAPGAADLPGRLSVFGATRLPHAQLEVLTALATGRQVHLWLPHPSPELWQAVTEAARPSPRRKDSPVVARLPFLASTARDCVELQQRLAAHAETAGVQTVEHHHAVSGADPGDPPDLLGAVQRALRADRTQPQDHLLPTIAADDRSVQVHACHGRARQVEVLREVIVGLLADDPTLHPRDVLVMCPDVEALAPAVSGAFGLEVDRPEDRPEVTALNPDGSASGHPGQRIPLRLTDRSLRQTNPQLSLLARLLDLAGGRVEASAVLDLAACAPVRHRFGFTDDELDRVRGWAVATRVRWGENAARRARFGLPNVLQGTWQVALDRILLGVAMAEDDESGWVGSALPLDDVDSTDVDLAGRLAEFIERLEILLVELTGDRPVAGWLTTLGRALDWLASAPADQSWQTVQARQVLADVADSARSHPEAGLRLADVRALLSGRLAGRPTRAGFRTGALTVCSLEPMRAVPHRVVCLLGMDDGTFPRSAPTAGDDMLLREPWIGERDRRSEDRQLFLDAVTAARQHLVIVYSGADERTGALRPPAVPVGELLDLLDQVAEPVRSGPGSRVGLASRNAVRDLVTVRHPLQPVDARNFTPGALARPGPFSFDAHAHAAAVAGVLPAPPAHGARLLDRPLPPRPRGEEDLVVDLDDLVAMLEHPARWFVRRRLGLWLPGEQEEVDDRIPLELDGLAQWAIGDRMLADCLAGTSRERALAAEYRRGRIPPRELGRALVHRIEQNLAPIALAARSHHVPALAGPDGQAGPGMAVDVGVDLPGQVRLTGTVPDVHTGVVVRATYSRLAAKHRLRAWVQVLALAAGRPDRDHSEQGWSAVTVGRGAGARPVAALARLTAPPAPVAVQRLADLVRLRDRALREVLPMPVATTAAYARSRQAGETVEQAEAEASFAWRRERDDPHLRLCWGEQAPLEVLLEAPTSSERGWAGQESSRLGAYARRVWDPLLVHEELASR